MKTARAILAALATTVAFAVPAAAQDKFKVGYLRVMDDAQAILAHEAGLYKNHQLFEYMNEIG